MSSSKARTEWVWAAANALAIVLGVAVWFAASTSEYERVFVQAKDHGTRYPGARICVQWSRPARVAGWYCVEYYRRDPFGR